MEKANELFSQIILVDYQNIFSFSASKNEPSSNFKQLF